MPPKKGNQRRPENRHGARPPAPASPPPGGQEVPEGDAKTGPELVWLDPRVIIWPEVRITSEYRDGEREALSASLEEEGQQQAIGVFLVVGQYVGADGKNRCEDAIAKGKSLVLCLVRQGSRRGVFLSNIATALLRGRTNPLSVVETFWKANQEEGVEVEELAAASGHPVDWVMRMLEIAEASPVVKQMLGEDRITLGVAELLARLETHGEQETALQKVLQERWTVAELRDYLLGADPAEEEPERPSRNGPAVRSPRVCTVCHKEQEHGTIQTMHVCDGCAGKLGDSPAPGPVGSEGTGDAALEGLMAAAKAATPDLWRARELLTRMPGGAELGERLGALAGLLEGGRP